MPIKTFVGKFLPNSRSHCLVKTSERVKALSNSLTEEGIKEEYDFYVKRTSSNQYLKDSVKSYEDWKVNLDRNKVFKILRHAYEASVATERDTLFCVDCSVNAWIEEDSSDGFNAYVIPYGERWIWDDFKLPKGVKDYSYWDNTDKPENVKQKDWEIRGKTWDKICLNNNWNDKRLTHVIIDLKENSGFNEISNLILGKDSFLYASAAMMKSELEALKKMKEENKIKYSL